jgi:uncharacterized membrane protein YheB (UPF0754 family)
VLRERQKWCFTIDSARQDDGSMIDLTPYLSYLAMPFIIAIVGYGTNWVAIRMMLYPSSWVGIGFVGWQGIIPRLRVRLTRELVRLAVESVCRPADMIEAMKSAESIKSLTGLIKPDLEFMVDDFMAETGNIGWEVAPRTLREVVYRQAESRLPELAARLLDDIGERADHLVDIKELAAQEVERKPQLISELIMAMFKREFFFIIMSGCYIGFPLGCIQAILIYFFPSEWLLILFGAMVGAGTNWIAIQILAKPAEPVKVLGIQFQGILLKRQAHVAEAFADKFTAGFLDARQAFEDIWHGSNKDEVRHLVKRTMRDYMEESILTQGLDTALTLVSRGRQYDELFEVAEVHIVPILEREGTSERLLAPMKDLFRERMANMPAQQFQRVFLEMFEQDKWLVLGVGAVLGGCVGFLQLVYLFGKTLSGAG